MSGLLRGILILVVVVIVAVGAGVAYLAANLNDLVKTGVETYGPQYTGTTVTLEDVDISLFSGEGELRGLVVGNPEGYQGEDAFSLGRVRIALDLATVAEEVVIIQEVIIQEAGVHAILKGLSDNNLQAILDNVSAVAPASTETEEAAAPGPQVIIERFEFVGGSAAVTAGGAGSVDVKIPDIRLTDIGRESNGATIASAVKQMVGPITAAVVKAGVEGSYKDLLGSGMQGVQDRVNEAAGGLLENLGGKLPFGNRGSDDGSDDDNNR